MAAHPIVHVELSAIDPKAASQYYQDIFGWQITVAPEFDYHMFQAEGGPGGGFVNIGGEAGTKAGDVLVYIASDDIEADLRKVEAKGGKTVTPKMEIPQTGWFGVFTDPSGNKIGLYTAMARQG
jgi:predicted enzyme related to lactoylglutathione lyase